MSLKKHGIVVDCEHCSCSSHDDSGGFEVTVPISDSETGIVATARLHCQVSPEQHDVSLTGWLDEAPDVETRSESMRQRISAALAFVAEHRICGNPNICPSEVVRIVEQQLRR